MIVGICRHCFSGAHVNRVFHRGRGHILPVQTVNAIDPIFVEFPLNVILFLRMEKRFHKRLIFADIRIFRQSR